MNMGGGGRGNSMNFPWNCERSVTLKYCQGVEKKNCQRLPNRGIARVCQNKISVSEYNNQKY